MNSTFFCGKLFPLVVADKYACAVFWNHQSWPVVLSTVVCAVGICPAVVGVNYEKLRSRADAKLSSPMQRVEQCQRDGSHQ